MKHSLQLVACIAIMTITAYANGQPPPNDGQERHGPPPEAFSACEGKSTGDACTVSTPRGELSGTCQMPGGNALACAPEGHNGGQERRGPPPEAFSACEGKSTGDTCTVSTPRGELNGACQMPGGNALACAPKDKPPR